MATETAESHSPGRDLVSEVGLLVGFVFICYTLALLLLVTVGWQWLAVAD